LLASLALAADAGSASELDVLAGKPAQLGDAHPGLDGDGEQRVVAAACPAVPVGGGEEGVGLGAVQEGHDGRVEAPGRDGEHPCDEGGVLGMAQGREPEQRVNRRQPRVAALGAVAAFVFEVVQERADGGSVEIAESQLRRGLPAAVLGECEQEPEPIAVGGDGVLACTLLAYQPFGEERLERGREGAHRWSCLLSLSSRSAASASSSGQAVRYQNVLDGRMCPR
jgi:hypothetical protein